MQVNSAEVNPQGELAVVWSESAARNKPNRARDFILATGGLLGGGIRAEYGGRVFEVILNLPLKAPAAPEDWLNRQFLSDQPHPIYTTGLEVDQRMQPVGTGGTPVYPNLYAAGGLLSGADLLHQRALDGVALVSGYRAGQMVGTNHTSTTT
jgi:glycerol-3-phosphate dehydrogenase subunit B